MKKKKKEIKSNHGGVRAGVGRPSIGDVAMSSTQLKARERKRKRDAGLIDKTFWLLPDDVLIVEELQRKALKILK